MAADRDWLVSVAQENKEDLLKIIKNSSIIRNQLVVIIDKMINQINSKNLSDDYMSPSWPYLQADRLGQLKSLDKIRRLVEMDSNGPV